MLVRKYMHGWTNPSSCEYIPQGNTALRWEIGLLQLLLTIIKGGIVK